MYQAAMYESELEELFLHESELLYGVSRERLLPYLFRRSLIVAMKGLTLPNVKKNELPSFLMNVWVSELAIPVDEGMFTYKNTMISVSVIAGYPLKNIYDNFTHSFEMNSILRGESTSDFKEWEKARKEVREWLQISKRKSQKYRNKRVYPFLVKKWMLDTLNSTYRAEVSAPRTIPNIEYKETVFKLILEEICEREILAFNETVEDPELISEKELEKYIERNLEDIEEGLRFWQSQYQVSRGRIDILAKDKYGSYVILELKVEKDADILWQKWYYTEEIKKRFGTEQVRFIAVLPHDYKEITTPLLEGDTPTDIYIYKPSIKRNKLVSVDFELIHSTYPDS